MTAVDAQVALSESDCAVHSLAEASLSDDDAVIIHELTTYRADVEKLPVVVAIDGLGGASSSSFTRALLLAVCSQWSPIETPATSRTAATTPNLTDPARLNATHGVVAPCQPLAVDRLDVSRTPEDWFVANLAEGESPCRSKRFDKPSTKRASPAHNRLLVKPPKHSWVTEQGFIALATDLPRAIENGEYHLRLSDDGAGGTYFVVPQGDKSVPVAVFKPGCEEVGAAENPRGNSSTDDDSRFEVFAPGEGYHREILAYELDHGHFAGVPQTVPIVLNGEHGSLQRYCAHMIQSWSTTPAKFDVASVHAIAVFDIRTLNCDRHGGNLLVRRDAPGLTMVPIDHGFILPDSWSDPDFEWSMWPQAKQPVSESIREYVAGLDEEKDAGLVRARLGEGPAEVIAVTTRLLKIALASGKSYTMKDLASFCRRPSLAEPAGLERLMTECRRDLDDGGDIDFEAVEAALNRAFP